MNEAVSTKEMSRDEWLKLRKSGLGGSDVAVILGFNKYKSPFQLYLEKTTDFVEEIDNEFIYWGNRLEEVVAEEFAIRTGKKVQRVNRMLRHPDYPFMTANLDRRVVGEKALLECKTTSAFNREAWEGDEVPAAYICQVQHYLAVTGYDKAYIAVLIGGNNFVWKEIERDDEFIEMMIAQEKAFWENHVLADVPPEIDGSGAAVEFLKKMYPQDEGTAISLDNSLEVVLEALRVVKEEEKQLQETKAKYENQIKLALETAAEGYTNNFKVSYKSSVRNSIDSKRLKEEMPEIFAKFAKETPVRTLRIKEVG